MTTKLRLVLALAATASTLPLSGALADDYDPPIYVDQAPEYTPVEVGSGWYLRGDVSYLPRKSYRNVDFSSLTVSYSDDETPVFASLGFGYHFNDYLRGDINFGLLPGNEVSASETTATDIATARVKNSARTAIVNGYVDLGTYVGITPYVGAGIGGARVKWDTVYDPNTTEHNPGASNWRFAYALMAGASYCLTDNLIFDAGYRYSHIQGGRMFEWDASSAGPGFDRGISSHEVRGGLRYQFGGNTGCSAPQVAYEPEPEPIYTK